MNGFSNLIVGAAGSIIATILTSLAWLTWNSYRRWDALWNLIGFKRAGATWLFYGNVQKEKLSSGGNEDPRDYATFEYGDIASVMLAFDRLKSSSRGKVRHSVGSDLKVADDGNVMSIGGPKWNKVSEKLLGMLGSPLYFERGVAGVIEKRQMHHSQNTYTPVTHDADGSSRLTDYGFIICGRGCLPGGCKSAILIAGYTTAGVLIATEFLVRMTWSEIRTLNRKFRGDKRFALLIQGDLEISDGTFAVSAPPKLLSSIPESDFREPYTYFF